MRDLIDRVYIHELRDKHGIAVYDFSLSPETKKVTSEGLMHDLAALLTDDLVKIEQSQDNSLLHLTEKGREAANDIRLPPKIESLPTQ